MPRPRKGFTTVELVTTIIALILILGLVVGGILGFRFLWNHGG